MADSALVIRFSEADRLVGPYRRRHDPSARLGVPAHVTVHFPWLPSAGVDNAALAAVSDIARTVEPFDVTFTQSRWFSSSVLWLAPEPERPLRELAERSAGRWPDFPLYQGQFADVVPHLTVGVLAEGDEPSVLTQVQRDVAPVLPVHDRAREISWLTRDDSGHWSCRRTFPLGAGD
jgi:2'-5' RNA ligase